MFQTSYRRFSQMVQNGGILNFKLLLLIKRMMDVAQILQGLSYKVRFTTSPSFFAFGLFILVFEISAIIHQQLVAMLRRHLRFIYRRIFYDVTSPRQLKNWSIMAVQCAIAGDHFY